MSHTLFPQLGHDHKTCVEQAINRARQICTREDVKLTALRERVLRVMLSSHQALGAYEIIERLSEQGRKLAPISVYRIIDVLLDIGLVRRIESKNAFFATLGHHDNVNSVVVMVCKTCNRVAEAEAPGAWNEIKSVTQANGFAVASAVLEIQGICPDCRAAAATHEAA